MLNFVICTQQNKEQIEIDLFCYIFTRNMLQSIENVLYIHKILSLVLTIRKKNNQFMFNSVIKRNVQCKQFCLLRERKKEREREIEILQLTDRAKIQNSTWIHMVHNAPLFRFSAASNQESQCTPIDCPFQAHIHSSNLISLLRN